MQLGTVARRRPQVSFWGLPAATLLPQLVSLKPAEGWEGLRKDLVGGTVTSLTRCLDMTRQLTTCSTEAPFRRMMASVKSGLSVKVDIGGGGDRKATTVMAPSYSVVAFHQGTEALPATSLGLTFSSPFGTPSLQVLVWCSATLTLTQEININPYPGLRQPATPSDTRALTKSSHGEHLDSTGKT